MEWNIVRETFEHNDELKSNYTLYQKLLRAMTHRDSMVLEKIVVKFNYHLISK